MNTLPKELQLTSHHKLNNEKTMKWRILRVRACHVLSCVCLFVTPWTVAHQAPLSMEFSQQEYWNGMPFPLPGDLPDPGIKPASPGSSALVG